MKTAEEEDDERITICRDLYKFHSNLPDDMKDRKLIEFQWREILNRTIEGVLSQLKGGKDSAVGAANQQPL